MRRATIFLVIACLAAPALAAADCAFAPAAGADGYLQQLQAMRGLRGCFADDADDSALTVKVREVLPDVWLSTPPTDANAALAKVREALVLIADDAGGALQRVPAEWKPMYAFVRGKALEDSANIDRAVPPSGKALWQWNGQDQAFQLPDASFALDYGAPVRVHCASSAAQIPPACLAALEAAGNLIREVNLMQRAASVAGEPTVAAARSALQGLSKDWDFYFRKTRSQYVWELALNSWRYDPPDDAFAAPPPDQLILLHPGPAFEYVGGGSQNERAYEAVAVVEVIGYNRFDWRDRDTGKSLPLPSLGASLVATFTPDNTGDRWGYGVLFHVSNALSLGITRRDTGAGDETTYLLSADLMRAVLSFDKNAALQKFIDED